MISPAIRPPSTAPGNEPTPPITTTTKVCTRIASPMSGASETTGAFTMPAKPAAIEPMPNTSMNTRSTLTPSESTITESSMPARTMRPSRVLYSTRNSTTSATATMPTTARR